MTTAANMPPKENCICSFSNGPSEEMIIDSKSYKTPEIFRNRVFSEIKTTFGLNHPGDHTVINDFLNSDHRLMLFTLKKVLHCIIIEGERSFLQNPQACVEQKRSPMEISDPRAYYSFNHLQNRG